MGTPATGELRPLANGWEARIRIEGKVRRGFVLAFAGETEARERCTAMAEIAVRLRKAGRVAQVEEILRMAAKSLEARPWQAVLSAVDTLCGGRATPTGGVERTTMKALGKDWRDGELHRRFRDHVATKRESSIQRDGELARLYVDDHIGHLDPADVTLDHCEIVMANIPEKKSGSTRRLVAQYMRRLLQMSVYPLRLRKDNPIPKGWLPRLSNDKAKECLYPDEDRALLACTDVPLIRRLFFGMAAREGGRTDEEASLLWRDVDLERGRISLDENKTSDPRDWELDPGVCRALLAWKARYCPDAETTDRVFVEDGVPLNINRASYHLRRDLRKAGVTREKLFEKSAVRQPIRAHDLRATFVTISLATGKTESWVSDRTGHKSSTMINAYRRKARGWNVGTLDALDLAIPELRPLPHECPTGSIGETISDDVEATKHLESRPIEVSPESDTVMRVAYNKPEPSAEVKSGALTGALDVDSIEAALAAALSGATSAGRWDIVSQLAKELEARRLARSQNVVSLAARRERR